MQELKECTLRKRERKVNVQLGVAVASIDSAWASLGSQSQVREIKHALLNSRSTKRIETIARFS